MSHGLAPFKARELIHKAEGALKLLESALENGTDSHHDATHEVLRVVLENQMKIVETLDLIKAEFDKFEEGLGKIL